MMVTAISHRSEVVFPSWEERTAQAIVKLLVISTSVLTAPSHLLRN